MTEAYFRQAFGKWIDRIIELGRSRNANAVLGILYGGQKNIFAEPLLQELGNKYGKTSAQIALRYLVQNKIAVIPKSVHQERMKQNFAVFDFEIL